MIHLKKVNKQLYIKNTAKDQHSQGQTEFGMNSSGDKGWCIIAPIEQYSTYRFFNKTRKCCNHRCPDPIYFHTLLLIIYLSAIKTLICREMGLKGSTSFFFAQNLDT